MKRTKKKIGKIAREPKANKIEKSSLEAKENKIEKPSAEAKALSLYLMAFKNTKPINKQNSKRINKQWNRVKQNELSMKDYLKEVQIMLKSYGGYSKVVEDTVWHYVKKTGKWELEGDDKYCVDAKEVADKIKKKEKK